MKDDDTYEESRVDDMVNMVMFLLFRGQLYNTRRL